MHRIRFLGTLFTPILTIALRRAMLTRQLGLAFTLGPAKEPARLAVLVGRMAWANVQPGGFDSFSGLLSGVQFASQSGSSALDGVVL